MGGELIKYKDFTSKFDLSKIIKGNYWDKGREKFIVKLENIAKKFKNGNTIDADSLIKAGLVDKIEAKNGLESLVFNAKNSLNDEKSKYK